MLLIAHEHLVSRIEVQAGGHRVHALGCVTRQGDLLGIRSDKRRNLLADFESRSITPPGIIAVLGRAHALGFQKMPVHRFHDDAVRESQAAVVQVDNVPGNVK